MVVRVKRREPCYTLRLQCFDPRLGRWVFERLPFFACASGRFEYCQRSDRTRNLVVEAHKCTPVDRLPVVCVRYGSVVAELARRLARIIEEAWGEARNAVDDCLEYFGVGAESYGYYLSMEDYDVCQYNRCDVTGRLVYPKWRVMGAEGVFREAHTEVTWGEVEEKFAAGE